MRVNYKFDCVFDTAVARTEATRRLVYLYCETSALFIRFVFPQFRSCARSSSRIRTRVGSPVRLELEAHHALDQRLTRLAPGCLLLDDVGEFVSEDPLADRC